MKSVVIWYLLKTANGQYSGFLRHRVLYCSCVGRDVSRTVTLRQAKRPRGSQSLTVNEQTVLEGEPFIIERHRAEWYPQPLYNWKTGKMQDKDQTDFVLSQRVQLNTDTGTHTVFVKINFGMKY